MKNKILFVILCLFVLPLSVYAGGEVSCSDVNDGTVLNNWGKDIGTLAGGSIFYCKTSDKSEGSLNSGGNIFELIYDGSQGKQRVYCLNHGLNAPSESTLTKAVTAWDVGPACAFYKYNGTGETIRHNRIRYIQNKCTVKCSDPDDTSNTCCSNEQCTDDFISDDCVGNRKSEPSDEGNSISVSSVTEESSTGSYFIYKANVSMNGKVKSYTPSIAPSISGAFVTDSPTGTSSVTNTTASTIYIKVPKYAVTTSMTSNLKVVANYEISCTYKKFGLTYYKPTKGGVRVVDEQRIAFREVKEFNPKKNKTKEDTSLFSLTPEQSTNDFIIISKIDSSTGSKLPGAVFGLYSDSSCTNSVVDVYGSSTVTTDGEGAGYFFVPQGGEYYLKEVSAPSGYLVSSSCIKAELNNSVTVKNDKIPEEEYGKIIINKKDMASSSPIEGVKFELLMDDKTTSATDKDGNTIGALTTSSDGKIEVSNLKYGTYYLKEISAPDKYIVTSELIEVVVNKASVELVVENALRNVTFIKIDNETKEAISGGKYRIVDEAGNSVSEFAMDNGTYMLSLAAGKYTFIEVNPPKGYVDANVSFEFEVSDEGLVTIVSNDDRHYYISDNLAVTVVNDKEEIVPDVPKTGVLNNKMVIGFGVLLIIGGVSSIIIIKRKRIN